MRAKILAAAVAALLRPILVESRIGSGVTVLTDLSLDKYMLTTDKVIVDFYDDPEQQAELPDALRELRGYGNQVAFAKLDAKQFPELAKRFVPNERYPQLVWFRHGEPTSYHRKLRQAKFITAFAMAMDRDPVLTVKGLDEVIFNPVMYVQASKASPSFKVLEVVAAKHMDTVAFAHKEAAGAVNISWVKDDAVVETYDGEMTVEALERWVNEQLTISEDLPESVLSQDGDVTVVVGKTFEDLVIREDKDVFLLTYAPWVGRSRKVFPVWNAFARRVAHVEHLVIAKINADRNRTPLLPTDDFPSIFLFKAGSRTPIPFRGNKTVEELVDFASTFGSKSFELHDDVNLMQRGFTLTNADL